MGTNNANCIIVNGPYILPTDVATLFGGSQDVIHYTDETDLSRLMVELGVYPSTSQARRVGRHGPVPTGFTEYKASKKRPICIWNPTEDGYAEAKAALDA